MYCYNCNIGKDNGAILFRTEMMNILLSQWPGKMKNISLIMIFAMIGVFIQPISAQEILTLEKAIEIALENNHNIKIAKINTAITGNNATAGNAGLLPRVDVTGNASYGFNNTKLKFSGPIPESDTSGALSNLEAGIGLSYTLFDGMGNINTYRKLKSANDLAALQEKLTIESTLMMVITGYYEVARLNDNLEIAMEALEISNERYERAKIKSEFGGTTIELLTAEVDLNNDSIQYKLMVANFSNAKRNLNLLVGRQPEMDFEIDNTLAINEKMDNQPEVS